MLFKANQLFSFFRDATSKLLNISWCCPSWVHDFPYDIILLDFLCFCSLHSIPSCYTPVCLDDTSSIYQPYAKYISTISIISNGFLKQLRVCREVTAILSTVRWCCVLWQFGLCMICRSEILLAHHGGLHQLLLWYVLILYWQ